MTGASLKYLIPKARISKTLGLKALVNSTSSGQDAHQAVLLHHRAAFALGQAGAHGFFAFERLLGDAEQLYLWLGHRGRAQQQDARARSTLSLMN